MEHSGRPVDESQPLALAPTHDLVRGDLDQLGGLGFAALEGGQGQRGVCRQVGSGGLVDRRDLVDQRRGHG